METPLLGLLSSQLLPTHPFPAGHVKLWLIMVNEDLMSDSYLCRYSYAHLWLKVKFLSWESPQLTVFLKFCLPHLASRVSLLSIPKLSRDCWSFLQPLYFCFPPSAHGSYVHWLEHMFLSCPPAPKGGFGRKQKVQFCIELSWPICQTRFYT